MKQEIVSTEDGSITLLDQLTGELYHNKAGAYTEALRNYVEACDLKSIVNSKGELHVLDVCFGLGYNTFVLVCELLKVLDGHNRAYDFKLKVMAIDSDSEIIGILPRVIADERLYPLTQLTEKFLEFQKKDDFAARNASFTCDLISGLEKGVCLDLVIEFADVRKAVPELVAQHVRFDFIFHDGFSPRRMPELWTYDLFSKYAELIRPHGKILTYSSAAAVRGALRRCGLTVMRTAAVGGKTGGTIAGYPDSLDNSNFAFPLSGLEETRLASRSAIPYRDPHLTDTREEIIRRRENEVKASSLPIFTDDKVVK